MRFWRCTRYPTLIGGVFFSLRSCLTLLKSLLQDVCKAFTTVNHAVLLDNLCEVRLRGPYLNMIKSFLTNDRQLVSIDDVHSLPVTLLSRLPQGSLITPLLYNISVNDMGSCTCSRKPFRYAGEIVLLSRHHNYFLKNAWIGCSGIQFKNELLFLQFDRAKLAQNKTHLPPQSCKTHYS